MSVYIKGMEMPKGCAFCKIKKRNGKKMICPFCDEEWDISDPMSADHRLENCPLVEVPPHGRLIDADRLKESLDSFVLNTQCHYKLTEALVWVRNELLDKASTVIPASKEDE